MVKNAIQHGFRIGRQQWRIAGIVYLLQLCLALTVGMQVYEVLHASIGNSLEINKLLRHYDHTVISDFLKVHGASITPLIGQLRWLLLVWLFFSIFIDGGLLFCATRPEEASGRNFWVNGAAYFVAFLKMAVFFLTLALLWSAALWVPVGMFFQPSVLYFPSEKYTVWMVVLTLLLWLGGLTILIIWSVLARLARIQTGAPVFSCLKMGWGQFWRSKMRYMSILTAFAGLQVAFVALYFFLESLTGMRSPFLILVVFFLQQAFVFCRIQVRQALYGSIGWGGA